MAHRHVYRAPVHWPMSSSVVSRFRCAQPNLATFVGSGSAVDCAWYCWTVSCPVIVQFFPFLLAIPSSRINQCIRSVEERLQDGRSKLVSIRHSAHHHRCRSLVTLLSRQDSTPSVGSHPSQALAGSETATSDFLKPYLCLALPAWPRKNLVTLFLHNTDMLSDKFQDQCCYLIPNHSTTW